VYSLCNLDIFDYFTMDVSECTCRDLFLCMGYGLCGV